MTSNTVLLILTISGVNLALVLGIVWKGGKLLGTFQQTMGTLADEMKILRERSDESMKVLERTVANLNDLEKRVTRLEQASDETHAAGDRRRRPVRA